MKSLIEGLEKSYKTFFQNPPDKVRAGKVPIIYDAYEKSPADCVQVRVSYVIQGRDCEIRGEGWAVWRVPATFVGIWTFKGEFPEDARNYEFHNGIRFLPDWEVDLPEEYETFSSWYDQEDPEVNPDIERKMRIFPKGEPTFTEKQGWWKVEQTYYIELYMKVH